MSRFLRTIAKIILAVFGLAVILIGGVLVAVNVSPKPFAWYVQRQFAGGVGVEPVTPTIYHELSQNVHAEKDIDYPSQLSGKASSVQQRS
jgi:hypothetical protein